MSEVLMPQRGGGRPRKHLPGEERTVRFEVTPTIGKANSVIANGLAREVMIVGARGDGKTIGVLGGMCQHAKVHQDKKFELPTKWIGVTDKFTSHKAKTFESLEKPLWKGMWRPSDGGHLWTATVNGKSIVELHLLGIEDQGAMDRVRTECTGVWFEEPAPTSVLVDSSGVGIEAWLMAMTSQRLPTHAYVAVMTMNYPDEEHWTWERFLPPTYPVTPETPMDRRWGTHPTEPSRMWFRIPVGERADTLQRAAWTNALKDRPDLLRRLIQGQPGSLMIGAQVAEGFSEDIHVATEPLHPIDGEPLMLGYDFGHTPCAIIGQVWRGERRIYAAIPCEKGGVKQHCENSVRPWITQHAPWALKHTNMISGCYDIAGQTGEQSDIEKDPVSELERQLPGLWYPGPIDWESRKHVLISSMNHHLAPGKPSLRIDLQGGALLIKALSGKWHYPTDRLGKIAKDLPKKPNHPWEDLGDSFIYWLWGLTSETQPPSMRVESIFSESQMQQFTGQVHVESIFDRRR